MAAEGFDLRISLQRLLTILVLTIVPLSIAGLYLTSRGDEELAQAVGRHFKIIADSKANAISQFVNGIVTEMGEIAVSPSVMEEAATADLQYRGANDSAAVDRIRKMQTSWNRPEGASLAQKILSTKAARLLKRYQTMDARFLRITITDAKGAVLAATHKPALYYYGNDDQWLFVYAGGTGKVQLTDVKYDDATKANYITVGVPILEEGSNRFLGAAQALVDVSSVANILNHGLSGGHLRAWLVKDDGTIIFGPEVALAMNLKAAEYPAVSDALSTAEGREAGHVVAEVRGGRTLTGFADTGLKSDYYDLAWIVLVGQDVAEATAPILGVNRFAFLMVILGLLMVVIFGVYFYLHRREQFTDIADQANAASG